MELASPGGPVSYAEADRKPVAAAGFGRDDQEAEESFGADFAARSALR